ncbi:MAG TPA: NifU family protein [Bacteroidia bacterium]|nr:NifU family protein [Bacteroidia bacterium]
MTTLDNGKLNERIETALDTLRPYLQSDNGDVMLIEVTEDMTVKLKFTGACCSCSMSAMTLRAGIEETLLRTIPELKKVEAVNPNSD